MPDAHCTHPAPTATTFWFHARAAWAGSPRGVASGAPPGKDRRGGVTSCHVSEKEYSKSLSLLFAYNPILSGYPCAICHNFTLHPSAVVSSCARHARDPDARSLIRERYVRSASPVCPCGVCGLRCPARNVSPYPPQMRIIV